MSKETKADSTKAPENNSRLAILLAMAMFVLVVDTSMMNVSISAIVADLDTTVSSVQSAIALEALVSAAFILIGSKIGDLYGRKRAYIIGLIGYGLGALAMTLTQSMTAVILFWAIIGGLNSSMFLSLIVVPVVYWMFDRGLAALGFERRVIDKEQLTVEK